MSKICAIISGGNFSPLDNIDKCDYIIACDKGYKYASESGIRPDYIIGDFDSYDGTLPDDIKTEILPCEKDDTDTMVAFRYAVDNGFDEIYLYCALGGRVDHFMGNLNACAFAVNNNIKVTVIDKDNLMYFFSNATIEIPKKNGFSLTVVSITDKCENITIKGTKWELENAEITNACPSGISNEWVDTAVISVGKGVLAVILSAIR